MKTANKEQLDKEFIFLRVCLLAQQALRIPIVLSVVATVTCFSLRHAVELQVLILWFFLFVGATVPRALFAYWILQKKDVAQKTEKAIRYYHFFVVLAAINGFCAGTAALLFFPTLSSSEQAFVGMILTGLVAGGVATSGSSPSVLAAYACFALAPLGIAWSLYSSDHSHLVTGLVIVFSATMIVYAKDGKKVLYQSFLIRRQRDEAYLLLQQKNEEISEAKRAIESLAQTKTRVLAAASHDLRQPLHALSIYSAVLSAKPSVDTLNEIGHNINQLVDSLAALLDALLDLSQLDSDSFPTQFVDLDLANIAIKISQELKHRAQSKSLEIKLDAKHTPVHNDQLIIERIVRNIADNAIKYTDIGFIQINTFHRNGKSCIQVKDTGRGIAQDQIHKIFEEFYQINNPGRDRSLGLGLGLSIVQRMTRLIGGEIQLDSEPGKGSCFTIELQASTAPPSIAIDCNLITDQLQGLTVLVIDDEEIVTQSTAALLKNWGVTPLVANNTSKALEVIRENSAIDFIIADLRLEHGENGAVAIQNLRQILGDVPALIISGETSRERLSDAKQLGLPVLQKPVSAEQLFQNIERLVRTPSLQAIPTS